MLKSKFDDVARCYDHQNKKDSDIVKLKDLLSDLKKSRIVNHLHIIQNSLRSKKAHLTRHQWRKLNTALSDIHYIRRSLEEIQE